MDTNLQLMGFVSACTGLKVDRSVEVDYVLGYWTGLDAILGTTYSLGAGLDNEALGKQSDTDERGAQIGLVFDSDIQLVGGEISMSTGYGKDFPIDWEFNLDGCSASQLFRFDLKSIVIRFAKKLLGGSWRVRRPNP